MAETYYDCRLATGPLHSMRHGPWGFPRYMTEGDFAEAKKVAVTEAEDCAAAGRRTWWAVLPQGETREPLAHGWVELHRTEGGGLELLSSEAVD